MLLDKRAGVVLHLGGGGALIAIWRLVDFVQDVLQTEIVPVGYAGRAAPIELPQYQRAGRDTGKERIDALRRAPCSDRRAWRTKESAGVGGIRYRLRGGLRLI